MTPLTLLDGFLVVLCIILVSHVLRRRVHGRTPPGPPGSWVVGNTYQIPTDKQWLKFDEWIKEYGEPPLWCSFMYDESDVRGCNVRREVRHCNLEYLISSRINFYLKGLLFMSCMKIEVMFLANVFAFFIRRYGRYQCYGGAYDHPRFVQNCDRSARFTRQVYSILILSHNSSVTIK